MPSPLNRFCDFSCHHIGCLGSIDGALYGSLTVVFSDISTVISGKDKCVYIDQGSKIRRFLLQYFMHTIVKLDVWGSLSSLEILTHFRSHLSCEEHQLLCEGST